MRKSKGDKVFDYVNTALLLLVAAIMIYPLYFTIIASVSEPRYVSLGEVVLLPKGFWLDAYTNVFNNVLIWRGYLNSIIYTVFGTLLSLAITIPAAYALSKRWLKGHTLLSWYFLTTMFVSGGLIPTYLLVRDLNLLNKPYTLIVLGAFSVFSMIISRIFYQTNVPEELYEAARIDGCSEFGQFFRIALPLSTPIIAVMALFTAVGKWNDFFSALIFLSNPRYSPLQLVLRNILIQNQLAIVSLNLGVLSTDDRALALMRQRYLAEAMKYSLIFIASAPLLIAYPFVQKHFVKGVLIGSLKG